MIPEEIIKNYSLSTYKNDWYRGEINLPKKKFIHFFKESSNSAFIFHTTILNFDDKDIIDEYIKQIDLQIDRKNINDKKLNKTALKGIKSFDSLVFAPFHFTNLGSTKNHPDFDSKTIYIFPIYNFELRGNETPEKTKYILNISLFPIDWNRKPSPSIKYRFNNPKHQYGTKGNDLIFGIEENVYNALSKFETNDCLMEVQNILKENITITFLEDTKLYKTEDEDNFILNIDEVIQYLKDFFRKINP